MMTSKKHNPLNGEWSEMKRLVLTRMEENSAKLDTLSREVAEINTRLAVLSDREDREMLVAKNISMKISAVIGTLVSALVAGAFGLFRGQ